MLVYDSFLNWDKETRYIWGGAPSAIKLSFCICRYLALAGQIVNIIYSSPTFLERGNVNCFRWFLCQMCVVNLLVWNMDLIMIIRIFALYDCSVRLGGILALWFIFCRGLDGWNVSRSSQEVVMDNLCIIRKILKYAKWFSASHLSTQAGFWLLTYRKYRQAKHEGWSNQPLIQLIMWDNSCVLLVLSGVLLSILPYDIYTQKAAHVAIVAMTCAVSIMSSRLILNVRSLKSHHGDIEQRETLTILTTQSHPE